MELMEYELKTALLNVESARRLIDSKMKHSDDDMLRDYHYELLDVELRLKSMVANVDKIP